MTQAEWERKHWLRDRVVFAFMVWTWCAFGGAGHWAVGVLVALMVGRQLDEACTAVERARTWWTNRKRRVKP